MMANDLLIATITEAGLSVDEVAEIAAVDPRTVQRWLGGRIPHPRYRQRLAAALNVEEQELWPDAARIRGKGDIDEIAGAWSRRSDPDAPDWRALMRAAERQIDLIGYSLFHVAEARSINKQLTEKARAGTQVRIAFANPDAEHVIEADLRQRPPGRLLSRIKDSRRRFEPLSSQPGIEVREHETATSHTILRFDEHMLLTIHLHGTPGFQAPLMHLRRERDYGIFDQLAGHVEDLWKNSVPLDQSEAPAPATPAAGDDLDNLDYVWRPSR